jgi:hypothetical protein
VPRPFDDIDQLCVNTVRTLSLDAVEKAKSGHPGLPMGAAPMAHVISVTTRPIRPGPAVTGSCCPVAMAACCSTRCCT